MSFGVKSGGGDGVPVVMPPRVAVEEDGGSFAIANLLNFQGPGVAVSDGTQSGTKNILITGGQRAAWDQPTWWIDPINGNDSNDGLTQGTPLKTAGEQHYRTGPVWEFNRDITMSIVSDLPDTDTVNLAGLRYTKPTVQGVAFRLVGVPKVVASGVAVVRSHAGNIPWGISCAALGSLASYVALGTKVVKTSGTDAGQTTFSLLKNEDGSIARCTSPAVFSANYTGMLEGTISTGDTFDIVTLPKVPSILCSPSLPLLGAFSAKNIHFSGAPISWSGPQFFSSCDFFTFNSVQGRQNLNSCLVEYGLSIASGANPYFQFGGLRNLTCVNEGRLNLEYFTVLQTCTTHAPLFGEEGYGSGITCHGHTFGVFDSPGSAIIIGGGQVCDFYSQPWGSGNTGHPVEVEGGGRLILRSGPPILTGGVGLSDIELGGYTAGPAFDRATRTWTADRDYSFANLAASVAAGGFGGNIVDPSNQGTSIVVGV